MTKIDFSQFATKADLLNLRELLRKDILSSLKYVVNPKEFYTPKEFSIATGMRYSTVINYCNTGKLRARQEKTGGTWSIMASEIERFLRESESNFRD